MGKKVKRSELVVGREYYFSEKKTTKGVFAGRDTHGIYFTPTVQCSYGLSSVDEWKGKVGFFNCDNLSDFEEVEDQVQEKDENLGEVLEFARWCLLKKHVGRSYNWLNVEELYEIYNEERSVNTDMDSWKERPVREVKRYFEKDLEEAWKASDRNMRNTFSSSAYKQIKFTQWLTTYKKEI